jgi:hypothetical protein
MRVFSVICACVLLAAAVSGCATAKRDTTGFAMRDSVTVDQPFTEAWQTTKRVLRDSDLFLYTRDKRGTLVAYTEMKRDMLIFTPHRTQFTFTIEEVGATRTRIDVETIDQVYGVSMLTYPDWHDRKTSKNEKALDILARIQERVAGGPVEDVSPEDGEPEVLEAEPVADPA